MEFSPKAPPVRGVRAWIEYLAANPNVTQGAQGMRDAPGTPVVCFDPNSGTRTVNLSAKR